MIFFFFAANKSSFGLININLPLHVQTKGGKPAKRFWQFIAGSNS